MKITNPITLDVARSNSYICLLGKQFDQNSRYLLVSLTNEGRAVTIPGGASVILRATRADGTAATVAGTVNGDGTATVEIDDYILEAAGNATLSIEVSSAGEVLTSASFNLNVQKADASGWVRVYVAAASLSAGNYYITIGGTSYSFTTTQTIPAGGMIYFASTGGTAQTRDASGNVLDASLTLTEASTGTELTSDVATMSFLDALAGRVAILEDTENAVVGSAEALLGGPAQDDAVYTIRASANTARKALRAIKGVTMGWNQLVNTGDTSVTVTSGHKYLSRINGTNTIAISNGTAISINDASEDNVFDLTLTFGSAIADYVYTLESGTPGAGVAWITENFPELLKYHAYDAGSLQSTKVSASRTSGFNIWDEEWETGAINPSTGTNTVDNSRLRSKNLIPVIGGNTYFIHGARIAWIEYDANGSYLRAGSEFVGADATFTPSSDAGFIRFYTTTAYGGIYNGDICISLSNPLLNGTYRPHAEHSYPIQPVELRGVLGLDANNKVITTGDEYKSDGTITRRFGAVDLGTLSWSLYSADSSGHSFVCSTPSYIKSAPSNDYVPVFSCAEFVPVAFYSAASFASNDKAITQVTGPQRIIVRDTAYSNAAAFTTAMSGVYLVYELATPTTETATPFTELQRVDDGIEEFVDAEVEAGNRDVAIPAGTDALAYRDLAALLGAIPNPPTTAGTYTLHATVTSTNATFSWS